MSDARIRELRALLALWEPYKPSTHRDLNQALKDAAPDLLSAAEALPLQISLVNSMKRDYEHMKVVAQRRLARAIELGDALKRASEQLGGSALGKEIDELLEKRWGY